MSDVNGEAKTIASTEKHVTKEGQLLTKVKAVATASGAVSEMKRRRISAIGGIGYSILVAVDGSKESWKALDAVLYFLDAEQDMLHTITIIEDGMSEDIAVQIKQVVEKANEDLQDWQVNSKVLPQNDIRIKERILDYTNKGNYDLLAVGMQGRKDSTLNPQRVFGSLSDPSLRAAKCTTLIAPSKAILPEDGESAVFVVVVDGSINSNLAYETARAWMKEGDHLHVIKVEDPRGDEPDMPTNMRSSFVGRQYASKLDDLENSCFELITGKKVVPEIIEFCKQKDAHFLLCGADNMECWVNKSEMFGSVSDPLVKNSECFVIISQLNIL